ncbi:PadR family transcriptional regulator [Desulforamulus aquiferis]|uniref:Helix-turn-helix transcriptional regulator n=1 Tax=Desulforamulus aquiferis TaxID=1397668 RepID=A0AAW7ZK32_9FIRM|nr:helix-turn-helix transcriptional regulator [Desulforamulus aquiferis]MDO7789149.1 helix-turn-helix transcriptional regulator [Desulforamulus aquiferis]RYD02673.1 hypothetical protein N752_23755 [Desulforamulus aquiferis]
MQEEIKDPALSYVLANIDKMLVPTLLFLLYQKPSHGYELIQKIHEYKYHDVEADPATVYRNLRRMEEDGLVISKWQTGQSGPARRSYELSPAGEEALSRCVEVIDSKVQKLQTFLNDYYLEVRGK